MSTGGTTVHKHADLLTKYTNTVHSKSVFLLFTIIQHLGLLLINYIKWELVKRNACDWRKDKVPVGHMELWKDVHIYMCVPGFLKGELCSPYCDIQILSTFLEYRFDVDLCTLNTCNVLRPCCSLKGVSNSHCLVERRMNRQQWRKNWKVVEEMVLFCTCFAGHSNQYSGRGCELPSENIPTLNPTHISGFEPGVRTYLLFIN